MPTGKIRWYDDARGFGFITGDDGSDVFLPSSALDKEVTQLKKGTRVDYSVIAGRKGPQALTLKVLTPPKSLVKATRPAPDDMVAIVEDVIKLLDEASNTLRKSRYPSAQDGQKLATMLRAVADNFDVSE